MKPRFLISILAVLVFGPAPAWGEIALRVSFKAILGPNDEWPNNPGGTIDVTGVNINSEQAVRDNITFTNDLLKRKGYPVRLFLRDDTVYTVSGQDDPWYTIAARDSDNKNDLEDAATANASARTTFRYHDDSINVYLNDSSSGVCSFPSGGSKTIFMGAGAYDELLLHEIGHFFNLKHTHGAEDVWEDGDDLSETLDDERDATAQDINDRYPGETQAKRDNLILNVMSYHQPQDIFVWQQLQLFVEAANGSRDPQASGEGFFVRDDGNDLLFNGKTYATRVKTLQRAVDLSTSSNDVILIRGTQDVANGTVFDKPHVWMKWRSDAVIE